SVPSGRGIDCAAEKFSFIRGLEIKPPTRGSLTTMSAKNIRTALGLLQDDPDNEQAWSELRAVLGLSGGGGKPPADIGAEDLAKLLASARRAHEMRREYDAVAGLLEMEVVLAKGQPREADLLSELSHVLDDELLDDERAVLAYEQLLKLRPGDSHAEEALERS